MNSDLFALPILPFEATQRVVSPQELPTPRLCRRYAFMVASALLKEPSWTFEKWVRDGDRNERCPRFLRTRAAREWWPVGVRMQWGISVTTLMRPAPLPTTFDPLLSAALRQLPEPIRALAESTLRSFWDGAYPDGDLSALDAHFGKAIYDAARAGVAAQQATFDAVVAEVQPPAMQLG